MNALLAELYDLPPPTQKALDWLASLIPDRHDLVQAVCFPHPLMRLDNGFAILALDALRVPEDIVLWLPRRGLLTPTYGRAAMLGEENLYGPRLADKHLRVWRSVERWLVHGRRGLVIIDTAKAARRLEFVPLDAEDDEHRRWLDLHLARPAPPIRVHPEEAGA